MYVRPAHFDLPCADQLTQSTASQTVLCLAQGCELRREGGKSLLAYVKGVDPQNMQFPPAAAKLIKHREVPPQTSCMLDTRIAAQTGMMKKHHIIQYEPFLPTYTYLGIMVINYRWPIPASGARVKTCPKQTLRHYTIVHAAEFEICPASRKPSEFLTCPHSVNQMQHCYKGNLVQGFSTPPPPPIERLYIAQHLVISAVLASVTQSPHCYYQTQGVPILILFKPGAIRPLNGCTLVN